MIIWCDSALSNLVTRDSIFDLSFSWHFDFCILCCLFQVMLIIGNGLIEVKRDPTQMKNYLSLLTKQIEEGIIY